MRVQNPQLETTKPSDPDKARWFIRPWVPVLKGGKLTQVKRRIYLGDCASMDEREATKARNRELTLLNRRQLPVEAVDSFGDFLNEYIRDFVDATDNLAASTRAKYKAHIGKHVRPAFGALTLAQVTTKRIDAWLESKAASGMAWATRMDLRNIMSGIFTVAKNWGRWKEENPALNANVGRKRAAREKRKLTVEQTRRILGALPYDVRLIVMVALFCTLRVSEVLGLCWKHLDLERGVVLVRQRYYRGDLDETKSETSERDVPLGYLADELKKLHPGPEAAEQYAFSVRTVRGVTRDDRAIHQHFLRKAAKKLGVYWKGFGFHAFRREAVTAIAAEADPIQAMRAAGHSRMDTTLLYGLDDFKRQEIAVRRLQEAILVGLEGGPVN